MEITDEEVRELLKFLSNQFIDRNSDKLYDGQVIYDFMNRAQEYVSGEEEKEL